MVTAEVSLERPRLSLAVVAVAVGLVGLALLIQAVEDTPVFGAWHNAILAANTIIALALFVLILGNVWRLAQDLRARAPGARLKLRLLLAFATLATAPVVIVYLTAVVFLHRGIESWIDERVSTGMRQALALSRSVLATTQRTDLGRTRELAEALPGVAYGDLPELLPGLRRKFGAEEVTVFGRNDRIIATSSELPARDLPTPPGPETAAALAREGGYVTFESEPGGRLRVRAAAGVVHRDAAGGEPLTVVAYFALGEQLSALADSVQTTYNRYGELTYLRGPIEWSFTLSLSVVVLLTLLGAAYVALVFAWRLVAPIQGLVAGTRAVAVGNLDTRIPAAGRDDFGALVESFNEMTRSLALAREEARRNAAEVESARANLAVILARLTSGVIVTDPDGTVGLANEAAGAILRCDLSRAGGTTLAALAPASPELARFVEACDANTQRSPGGWREQIVLTGEAGRRVLICGATPITGMTSGPVAQVLVFDDITALLQAQRDAAWGEVARRLAHEIKNPLTPIQLSAERIRRRCLGNMGSADAEIVDRATTTIVQQVEAMRDMVNAFGDYARSPELAVAPLDLNRLVREVAELYHTQPRPEIRLALDPGLGDIAADRIRIRQLLHNLIRNAVDALEGRADGWIEVATAIHAGTNDVEIRVRDNGPGIEPELLDRIFEPYVTSKPRGTGLGLAIVRRLVEEHGGAVVAENRPEGGACIIVTLPAAPVARERAAERRTV